MNCLSTSNQTENQANESNEITLTNSEHSGNVINHNSKRKKTSFTELHFYLSCGNISFCFIRDSKITSFGRKIAKTIFSGIWRFHEVSSHVENFNHQNLLHQSNSVHYSWQYYHISIIHGSSLWFSLIPPIILFKLHASKCQWRMDVCGHLIGSRIKALIKD